MEYLKRLARIHQTPHSVRPHALLPCRQGQRRDRRVIRAVTRRRAQHGFGECRAVVRGEHGAGK